MRSATIVGRPILDGLPFRMAALVMPADKDYLALARLAAMHVAGMLDLPIGRVGDLRLAVHEACALLLSTPAKAPDRRNATAENALELSFDRCPGELRVNVRGPAPAHRPDPEDIGWLVLQALVDEVRLETTHVTATATATATVTLIASLPEQ
jgi:serine/threonine-protein kinase RsbW